MQTATCSRSSSRSSTRSSRCRSPTSARCSPSTAIPSGHDLLWITVAMVGARSLAMALNRLIDMGIDARTRARRAASCRRALLTVGAGARVLRRLALRLPGRRLAARPDRALAVADPGRGVRDLPVPQALHVALPSLAGRGRRARAGRRLGRGDRASCRGRRGCSAPPSATWVAGFDLFYSLFDLEIDREQGLHSWADALRRARRVRRRPRPARADRGVPRRGRARPRRGRVVLARRAGGRRCCSPTSTRSCGRATCAGSTRRSSP